MKLSYAIALALLTTATASTAFGQEGAAGDDAKWKIVQRDPDGTKGVSPYEEELFNGRRAFAKGDHAGAIAGFDAAIGKDAERLAAYLLKAQVQIAKGDVDAAKATIETGKQKKGTAPERAKLLFLESDVAERKQAPAPEKPEAIDVLTKAWDTVKATWSAYAEFVAANSSAGGYAETASDRKKKVDDRVQREKDYGAVRDRIEKNAAEREKNAEPGD